MRTKIKFLCLFTALILLMPLVKSQTVALDNWFNRESTDHYYWNYTAMGGYSEWGTLFTSNGAILSSLQRPDSTSLANVSVYIIVDPDTTSEAASPNYILLQDISIIEKWVANGGVLALLANDAGNCEFTHLNQLAAKFGMHFNFVKIHNTNGTSVSKNLSNHFLFNGVDSIFIKGVSSINISSPAKSILTENSETLMAESKYGKGMVIAIGDPWIYNEYINTNNNKKAAQNFTKYLLHDTIINDINTHEQCAFSIYPNPSNGIVHIVNSNETKSSNIIVKNVHGEIVASFYNNVIYDFTINISELKAGLYFIELYNEKSRSVIKFIKY